MLFFTYFGATVHPVYFVYNSLCVVLAQLIFALLGCLVNGSYNTQHDVSRSIVNPFDQHGCLYHIIKTFNDLTLKLYKNHGSNLCHSLVNCNVCCVVLLQSHVYL